MLGLLVQSTTYAPRGHGVQLLLMLNIPKILDTGTLSPAIPTATRPT